MSSVVKTMDLPDILSLPGTSPAASACAVVWKVSSALYGASIFRTGLSPADAASRAFLTAPDIRDDVSSGLLVTAAFLPSPSFRAHVTRVLPSRLDA